MAPAQAQDRIVIGVDFGTTFSGVAEAYSGTSVTADEINVIKTWPGGNNVTSDKVPSEIAYGLSRKGSEASGWASLNLDAFDTSTLHASLDESTGAPGGTNIRWGFQLQPNEQRLRCVKLFLDSRQELPAFVSKSEMKQLLAKSGKEAVSVVADYLGKVYEHTKEELVKRYGDLFVQTTDTQWILTVPAIWSDAAKDATLTAARRAGMGPQLILISEPEAAAVYTLQAIQPNHLKVGDNIVVCDAGGGTVDLIAYEIKQTRPLRIEESAEGSGACCGAAMLNAKFEDLIRQKMGNGSFTKFCREKSRTWQTAQKFFEDHVKRNFDPTDPTDFNIPFPGAADDYQVGIEQGFLTLSFQEVANMFRPIITDIIDLVEGQIAKVRSKGKIVTGVVLVGGFGQSACLYKALKLRYTGQPEGRQPGAKFEVLKPANAWTAVVRGAVLRGMEDVEMVVSRKSRRHYGVTCRMPFDPAIHPKSCRVWDEKEGVWRAANQMEWYIEKGQTVSSTEPILFDFYRNFASGASKTIVTDLIVCDKDRAPAYFRKANGFPSKVLCSTVINLANVPARLWESHRAVDGTFYQRLSYQIGMQIESGGLKFDLKVDGVSYGNVTASFDSE